MTKIQAMSPRARGELSDAQQRKIDKANIARVNAEVEFREIVVQALLDGASFSEVSKFTGLSTNTLQRWKKEAGK